MLAAMYSETGSYQQAVTTAQHALELAVERNDNQLADALRANIARYQVQLQQAHATPGGSGA